MSNEFAGALVALEALTRKVIAEVKPSLITTRQTWYEYDEERNALMSDEKKDETMKARIWKALEAIQDFKQRARAGGAEVVHEEFVSDESSRRFSGPAIPLYTEIAYGLGTLNSLLQTIEYMRKTAEK